MKTYKIHCRERTDTALNDIVIEIEAKNKKQAQQYGKNLEATRDNFWFIEVLKNKLTIK